MSGFGKFKKELPSEEKFYNSLTGKKLAIESMSMFLSFGKHRKRK